MFKRILILSLFLISFISIPAFSATWVVADFNSGNTPINIDAGSGINPVFWATGYNYPVFVSTITHGNTGSSLEVKYGCNADGSFLQINFGTSKDISQYKALSFWVKGAAGDGTERFCIDLRANVNGSTEEPSIRPDVRKFISSGKISTSWQKIVIPVTSLLQGFASTSTLKCDGIVLDFTNGTPPAGIVYIDDIEFHTKCDPIWVDNFEAGSTVNAFGRNLNTGSGGGSTPVYTALVTTRTYQSANALEMNYTNVDGGYVVYEMQFADQDNTTGSMPLDLSGSGVTNLEFALQRGLTQGATLQAKIELWDVNGVPAWLDSTLLDISNSMQLYTVPISVFAQISSSCTKRMALVWSGSAGTVGSSASTQTDYLDQVRFVNNSTPTAPTSFLQNGQAITDGFTISTTSLLQVTAQSAGANTLIENVRFEHDGLSGGQTWYTIGKETDTADGTYTFNWNSTSLPAGTTYQVRAVAENISGNYAYIKLSNCNNDLPPADITDLAAVAAGVDGSVRLTWTAPGDNGTSGTLNNGAYLIKAATSYIPTPAFDSIPNITPYSFSVQLSTTGVTPFAHQSYVLTGLYPGTTYFFAIKTRDVNNTWSVWEGTSAVINQLSFAAAPDFTPNAVVVLTALQGTAKVNLQWVNPTAPVYSNDYSKYWVYMATSSFVEAEKNNTYVSVAATVTYNALQNPATAQIIGLLNYTTYFFHISTIDNGPLSSLFSLALDSFSMVETSTMTILGLPDAPSGFFGTAVSTIAIDWSWIDSPNDAGYRIKFASSPADSVTADLGINTVGWSETDLSINAPYARTIAAFNGTGESPLANSATVYTLANPPLNNSLVLSNLTKSSATLTWQANNNPPNTRYGVSQSPDGYYVNVTTVIGFASGLTDVTTVLYNLTEGGTYYFRVWSYNGDQRTSNSVSISTRTMQTITPTGFAPVVYSSYSICWSWNPVMNADGYRVRYASSPATSASGPLANSATFWIETGLTGNSQYGKQVVSLAAYYESALSNAATVYTLTNPPSTPNVSNVAKSSVTVSWGINGNTAGTRFGLSYSFDQSFVTNVTTPMPYSANFTGTTTTYIGLNSATTYFFKIWTYNGDQRLSGTVSTSTRTLDGIPSQPANFKFVARSTSTITWGWDDAANDFGYRVKNSQSLVDVSTDQVKDTVSWTEASLIPNTNYSRCVAAFNGPDESPVSNSSATYTLANPPLTPVVSNVLTAALTVSWSANNNSGITHYGVSYSSVGYYVNLTTAADYNSNNTAVSASLSSLTKGTTYFIRVWAYNNDQIITTDVQTSTCTLTVMDITKPVISTYTVISDIYALKTDIPVKATVTDDELVSGATLNYMIGSGAWVPLAMTIDTGATNISKKFTSAIPGSDITAYGSIYYYLSAVDGNSNVSSSTIRTIIVSQLATQTVSSGTVTLQDANPDDGTVSVTIPEGALKTKVAITIEPIDATLITVPPAASATSQPASAYEFGPTGTAFRKPVTLTLLYTDLNPKDGIEDNLKVAVKDLRVFFWDGIEWRLLGGTVNDFNTTDAAKVNTVTVPTMHFSRYALFPVKSGTTTYKPKEKIITPASKDGFNDFAQFDGLSGQDVKIEIFDIQGRKTRTINVLKEGNTWNGLNDDGYIVESGVYIFQFKFEDKLYSGTIIVAK